ncbi:MAG: class I SAM-dependent methyltransferase [SAR202 cluster bacterium]|nr:class I SAM-dependent methyltransferase [SAR202 cluster bacterium]
MARMYDGFAHLWPLVSPHADYIDEARHWRKELIARIGPGMHDILELGVGGGHNLHHVLNPDCDGSQTTLRGCDCRRGAGLPQAAPELKLTAVDLSETMLAMSASLNPEVEHLVGDMRNVRLNRKFSAVLIHDAITCMLTEDDLRDTFETAKVHLAPGGLFITAPDWYKDTFPGLRTSHHTRRNSQAELTYFEYNHDSGLSDTTMESIFVYFIKEAGQLRVEQDRHISGLFPMKTWIELLAQAGFETEDVHYPDDADGRQEHLLVSTLVSK